MLKFIQKLLGNPQDREVKRLWPVAEEINRYADSYAALSDDELRAKTDEFRARIRAAVEPIEASLVELKAQIRAAGGSEVDAPEGAANGQPAEEGLSARERQHLFEQLDDLEQDWLDAAEGALDEMLPEAFGVVKETCRRFVGKSWVAGGSEIEWQMVPYDVQHIGGAVLHQGDVAEMKTGEGKTLTSVAPIYLNALVGRGVHVVTVNPYLAQRDAEWMAPVFGFHGLTVDCIDRHESHSPGRREAYRADITYGTNNEFGFDYLRDNSFVVDADQLVQRGHHFAIVDEVDSVLIDEARTPLIISGPVPQADVDQYNQLRPAIDKLATAQQKLVAKLAAEAAELLKKRDEAQAAGNKKEARRFEEEAGLALLRAQRGFPKNKRLAKLKQEPGVEQLIQSTYAFYLQDSGKRMPEVDDALYYTVDEKQHGLEMTDQGRISVAKSVGEDIDFFVIPDMGEEIAQIERQFDADKTALYARVKAEGGTQEERDQKIREGLAELSDEMEAGKRELNTHFALKSERIHAVNQLLRAYTMYEKDIEYIVQEGKVMIVDEHTGRVLSGRRYSDGLHQAIEAKENVKVQAATQTYATVTLQNYFRLYHKLAGMTGTAETEAEEFGKIYDLNVVVVPTNKPIARDDRDDLVFRTKRAKYGAVIDKIREYHEAGQPVLVGTTSVEVSEQLSRMLQRDKLPHNVLNAKSSRAQAEAEIVAQAGQPGAITIATNMAGRGTDIKLAQAIATEGLAIIGTERHDSRRIDLQLRGRAGRQGDPGVSQFYVSLEDNLMRLFGNDRTARIMDKMGMKEDEVIEHPWITKSIERAQKKVEQNNFAIRKRQLEYDDVLNAQRTVIYDRRMNALQGDRLGGDILDMLRETVTRIVQAHFGDGDLELIREKLLRLLAFDLQVDAAKAHGLGEDGLIEHVLDAALTYYKRKRAALAKPFYESAQRFAAAEVPEGMRKPEKLYVDFSDGKKMFRATVRVEDVLETEGQEINDALERVATLSVIDARWTEHLRDLDEVKEGVGLRAYGQKDPVVEYKMEAFRLFSEMIKEIDEAVVGVVFKAGPMIQQQRPPQQRRAPQQPAQQQGQQPAPTENGDASPQQEAPRRRPAVPTFTTTSTAPRPRLDQRKARAQHASADADYGVKLADEAEAKRQANASRERDPSAESTPEPVVVERQIGRNEMVVVLDPSTGRQESMKYKHAQKKIEEGWSLIS